MAVLDELGNPDPELAHKLGEHRRRARQQVFSLSLQTGLAFDTNVTYLGDSSVSTTDQISGERDGKFASQLRIDYAPIASPTDTLAFGARLDHTWHFAVEEFDYQDYGAYLRYARRIGRNWEADVRYDYDVTLLGNESFLSNHALSPGVTYYWNAEPGPFRLDRSRVYYEFGARDFLFETEPAFDRDGFTHAVGCEQSFLFSPREHWTWDLAAGYKYTSISTEGSEFDRGTHDFYLGLGVPLVHPADPQRYLLIPDKELVFRFNAQWHLAPYRAASLIDYDHDRRSDLITTLAWSLSQKLIEDPALGDLTLHAIIHWTNANSNVTVRNPRAPVLHSNPFTYDKVVYGIQLEWTW